MNVETVLEVELARTAARLKVLWAHRQKTEVPLEVERELDQLRGRDPHPYAAAFCERLGMSALQRDLWTTLVCLATRLPLGMQVGEMLSTYGRTTPTLSLVAMLVEGDWDADEVMEALRGDQALVRFGLVGLLDPGRPFWERRVVVDETVIAAFLGAPLLPAELAAVGFVLETAQRPFAAPAPEVAGAVVGLLEEGAGGRTFVLEGERGTGRKQWMQHAAGRTLIVGDLTLVKGDEEAMATVIRQGLREAWLREALCYFELGDGLDEDGGAAPGEGDEKRHGLGGARPSLRERHHLEQMLAAYPGDVAVGVSAADGWSWSRLGARVVRVPMRTPSTRLQADAWDAEGGVAPGISGAQLAHRFPLPLRGIRKVKDLMQQRQRAGVEASVDDLTHVARRRLNQETGRLATAIATDLDWEDLILADDLMEQVHEIIRFARHRDTVLETYGMSRWSKGGLHLLLAGEPGTGKTTLATLLGREIGRETLKVNMDQVFSRYVGETEKHLVQVFALAERSRSLLLLDEADALLAKRTEVKGSNDRFGNLAVNVVLQLMEEYNVVSVATTNRESGLDEASLRRFSYRMTVPPPDAAQRAELFRRMVPQNVAVDPDIDWDTISQQVEVTGGIIRNIMMRMAAMTAANAGDLSLDVCLAAINSELKQLGRLPIRFG